MKKTWHIEIKTDRKGEWRWSVTAANGEPVGPFGEGYKRRAGAIANFTAITGIAVTIHGRVTGALEWKVRDMGVARTNGLFV